MGEIEEIEVENLPEEIVEEIVVFRTVGEAGVDGDGQIADSDEADEVACVQIRTFAACALPVQPKVEEMLIGN